MRRNPRRALTLALVFSASAAACGHDNPVTPNNRSPAISSLTAFPTAIGPGDSAIVICQATDPDGNALVYDWLTDGRLIIKGNQSNDPELYNSPYNTQVFYHGPVSPFDSAWVECTVRDGKGGADVRLVNILVNQ